MRTISYYGLAVIFLCIFFSVKAQQKNPVNSDELLNQGEKLNDAGKYKEAIALYKKISRSDTNYYHALHELSLSSYMDSNFEASKKYTELGLQLFPEKATELYNLLANNLDELGKKEEALQYYDKIIKLDANNYLAWFNKGVTFYKLKRTTEAKACFEKTILIYPYYASAHYFLGVISFEEGNIVPALLSFSTNLIVNPENRYVNNTVGYLTNIAVVKDEVLKNTGARKPSADDNFDLQQEIVLSKIALDKKYKLQTDVEDPITKQLQVVLEKLEYDKNDKGFFMQYYVPFYQQLFAEKRYNGHRTSGNDEGIKKVYYPNGQLSEEGNYNNGNLHGLVKYYYQNGKIKSEENWYNGEQNGISKYYDETGKLKQTRFYYYGVLQSAK